MFMEQRYMIDGFEFCYEEDEKRAKEEFARIKALSSRIDEDLFKIRRNVCRRNMIHLNKK